MRFPIEPLPRGAEFYYRSRADIERAQLDRISQLCAHAWQNVPFYQELWADSGVDPARIRTWDQFGQLPVFDLQDIRRDLDRHPPFGSYQGISPTQASRIHSSGGTTGVPRPYLFTPDDWQNAKTVSSYLLDVYDLRPGQRFQVSLAFSSYLGAFVNFDGLTEAGLTGIPTSSGAVTSTEMQVRIAQEWGTQVWLCTAAFALHLADTAVTMGLDPAKDLQVEVMILGAEPMTAETKDRIRNAFGCRVYEALGQVEAGGITATSCSPGGEWLHVLEHAALYQVIDPATRQVLPDGEEGTLLLTTTYREAAPMIRYNTMDLSTVLSREPCPGCGRTSTRISPLKGRADDLLKVKGVFLYQPTFESIVGADERCNGEFLITVDSNAGRDSVRLEVEVPDPAVRHAVAADLVRTVKQKAGLGVTVVCVDRGAVHAQAARSLTGKTRRIIDARETVSEPV